MPKPATVIQLSEQEQEAFDPIDEASSKRTTSGAESTHHFSCGTRRIQCSDSTRVGYQRRYRAFVERQF
jgi:hypothetical protein